MVDIVQETFRLSSIAGDTYLLTGPLHVTDHDGLGIVRPRRAARQGANQHGQTLSSALLQPRIVTLKLYLDGAAETDLRVERTRIEQIMAGLTVPAYLDVTLPSGVVRRLDVYHYDGFLGARKADDLFYSHADTLQLIADDPIAYDPVRVVVNFGVWAGGTGWPIPWLIPWTMGVSTIDKVLAVTYAGTWESYPVIRFTGPLEDPVLQNHTTGETLSFSGTHITAGHYFEVDCRYGYKRVLGETGVDETEHLTTNSDLATFHLAARPEAVSGINEFHLVATGTTSATSVIMMYYTRYWGVI